MGPNVTADSNKQYLDKTGTIFGCLDCWQHGIKAAWQTVFVYFSINSSTRHNKHISNPRSKLNNTSSTQSNNLQTPPPTPKPTVYATKTTLIALLATVAATTFAASTAPIAKRVAANNRGCSVKDDGVAFASYSVEIGIAYNGGSGCNDVLNAITNHFGVINWQCVDDGSEVIQLCFNGPQGNANGVNML